MPFRSTSRRPAAIAGAVFLACASLAFSGCALFHRYDMVKIHQLSAARPGRHPVVVLHGFIGSKLRNESTHELVWGRFMDALTTSQEDGLALPIDRLPLSENQDGLVPYALYESVAGVKFYGALLEALQQAGGYRLGEIDDPKPDDTLFVFTYDWRRDNVESAQRLGRALRQIKTRLGAPDLQFDLVAHSMGGMIALYYMKYGVDDVLSGNGDQSVTWAGARDLNRVVLLGAPLRGTMGAFKRLNTGLSRSMSPEVVFTMPSMYQLLPHAGEEHLIDESGEPLPADLYDAQTWVRYGWSVFAPPRRERTQDARNASDEKTMGQRLRFLQAALDRAQAFGAALDRDDGSEPPVPLHIFGSDCVPTLDKALVKQTASGPLTLFDSEALPDRNARWMEELLMVPGDGTVTADSLRGGLRSTSTFFVCDSHGLLPANTDFQTNLVHVLLGGPERRAAVHPSVVGD